MKVIPTPGAPPMAHMPAPRERRDGTHEADTRREALDMSSIRSLEKGTTGITPTEMERADRVIQEARKTVDGHEKSPEWQMRFKEVFDLLTRKMGITPPLATEIANAILFVPTADDAVREEAGESEEESAASNAEPVEEALYDEYVSTNPVLRRLAAETRVNQEGDEIEMTGAGDLESDLKSQEAVLLKMEAVARDLIENPVTGMPAETESPARP